jgi:Uncharacterized conserved protein
MRGIGTRASGIRTLSIVKSGEDLSEVVLAALKRAIDNKEVSLNDRDILGITESLLARCQGNFVTFDNIREDLINKFGENQEIGIVFPIFSRNRFLLILKAISRSFKKVYVQLNYPNDEVGNPLVNNKSFRSSGINPYSDSFTEGEFKKVFTEEDMLHPFTGINYIDLYKSAGDNIEVIISNKAENILEYTNNVIVSDIHTRFITKELLESKGGNVIRLDEIMNESINGSGYNKDYGLLGSNYSMEDTLKLFPRDGQEFVSGIQSAIKDLYGKHVEVMIYGDGAFKDPVAGIWELADPVVSPFYTEGLNGTPNELKLKYLVDNNKLSEDEMKSKIKERQNTKQESLGTTPRRITDLVGSLCDLVSGSGDKGTPIVLVQGYFDNYSDE